MRPFGFENDKISVRPEEAEILRALVYRFLDGESLRSLTMWLNRHEIAPVRGSSWRTPTLAAILRSPRIAGLREYRSTLIGPATWPGIITLGERERILAVFAQRHVVGRRSPTRSLLSGLLRCGKCGGVLFSAKRATQHTYVCVSGPDHRGCGRLSIASEPVEAEVLRSYVERFAQGASPMSLTDPFDVAFLRSRIDHVVIEAGRAGRIFDPLRVKPTFRGQERYDQTPRMIVM